MSRERQQATASPRRDGSQSQERQQIVRALGAANVAAGRHMAGRQETEPWTCKVRLKYLFKGLCRRKGGLRERKGEGEGQGEKEREREKERDGEMQAAPRREQ